MATEKDHSPRTADPKTVLCFGDSLTWGFDPRGGIGFVRYGFRERWTRQLQAELGSAYHVIEDGLNGRTTVFDDPMIGETSGLAQLPIALKTNMPLDLVVLLLGSNDTKARFAVNGDEIARALGRLLDIIAKSNVGPDGKAPHALVLVPPEMGDVSNTWLKPIFDSAHSRAALQRLRETYQPVAEAFGAQCFDLNQVVGPGSIDGMHFDPESLKPVGVALAQVIRDVFRASSE